MRHRALGTAPLSWTCATGPGGPTAPSVRALVPGTGQGLLPTLATFGAGPALRRGIGISPWGASASECPPCPVLETKRSGRRELRAEGIQWQLVHLSARRERLSLTFMSRAELGQPAAAGAREKRQGQAGAGGEVEPEGARPRSVTSGAETRPRRPGRWPSPQTHLQHLSASSSWCLPPREDEKLSQRSVDTCYYNYEARTRRLPVWERSGRSAPVPALYGALLGAPEPWGCRDGVAD